MRKQAVETQRYPECAGEIVQDQSDDDRAPRKRVRKKNTEGTDVDGGETDTGSKRVGVASV